MFIIFLFRVADPLTFLEKVGLIGSDRKKISLHNSSKGEDIPCLNEFFFTLMNERSSSLLLYSPSHVAMLVFIILVRFAFPFSPSFTAHN
jgi:hypothetical protein